LIFYKLYQGYFSFQLFQPKTYLSVNSLYLQNLFTAITPRFISLIINRLSSSFRESPVFDRTKYLNFSLLNIQSLDYALKPFFIEVSRKFQEESNKRYNYQLRSFLLKNSFLLRRAFKEILVFFNRSDELRKATFYLSSNNAMFVYDNSKKLKFFVNDFFFDEYVKTNFIWYLHKFIPGGNSRDNALSNYVKTFYLFAGKPIIFQNYFIDNTIFLKNIYSFRYKLPL